MAADRRKLLGRLIGFGALPLLSIMTPLLALPLVARSSTVGEWGALAVGQSVGGLGAFFVGLGFAVTGVAEVAREPLGGRSSLYAHGLSARLTSACFVCPAVGLSALLLVPEGSHALAAVMAVTVALSGLSIGWFAVGVGNPRMMAVYDAMPRAISNLVGGALAYATGLLLLYPCVLLVTQCGSLVVFHAREVGWPSLRRTRGEFAGRLRRNAAPTLTEVVAAAYSVGAPAILAVLSPTAVAQFGSGDRLSRIGSAGVAALSNGLQGWVAEPDGRAYLRRLRASFTLHAVAGLALLLGMGLFGPRLSALLFGADLAIEPATAWGFGTYLLFLALETVTGRHVLAVRGRSGILLATTLAGSVLGLTLVSLGALCWGATGAVFGIAAALAAVVVMQCAAVVQVMKESLGAPVSS